MNLDDFTSFEKIDSLNMLAEIDGLPEQLQKAWAIGQASEALRVSAISRAVICGMGGSAIGAELVSAYIAPTCRIPILVHRNYGLPAWACGSETLVILSSHSGDTEEALDSLDAALRNGCQLVALTTGGSLAERARAEKFPLWQFEHAGMPRAAVGYSFGLLLAIFSRLGLIGDPVALEAAVQDAVAAMKKVQDTLRAEAPVTRNPAKRQAGQLVGRWINVFGAGILAPVARRWKTQVNELAKAGAGFEVLPEADHNTLAGSVHPSEILSRTISLFLHAPSDHPRNQLRLDLTRQVLMMEGFNTDVYRAQGDSPLAHMWTAVHFGDYMAYYLAMAYGIDPTPIAALENFKAAMKAAR